MGVFVGWALSHVRSHAEGRKTGLLDAAVTCRALGSKIPSEALVLNRVAGIFEREAAR